MIALRQRSFSTPLLAAFAMVIVIGLWCGPAVAAASPLEPTSATVSPPMLTVITHACIVYGIAIVISILTAVLIKGMNVVMAARSGNGAE